MSGAIWRKVYTDVGAWMRECKLSPSAQLVAFHILAWPDSNRVGLFWCPASRIANASGLQTADVRQALDELTAAGFCVYDPEESILAVRKWAVRQLSEDGETVPTFVQGGPKAGTVAFSVQGAWKDAERWTESALYPTWYAWNAGPLALDRSGLPVPQGHGDSGAGTMEAEEGVGGRGTPKGYGVGLPPQDTETRRHRDTNSGSIARPPAPVHAPAHAPAREAPAAAAAPAARPVVVRAPTRDPWPEDASRAAADLWIALRREEGVEPLGDVCEPFERAALMLRDKHRIPAGEVPRTLERIVELAHISPTVRASRHGDLFRDTFHLLGNPSPKGGGVPMVDKLWRYLEDLAQADARARASEPPEPAEIPYEEERAMAEKAFDDEGYADWLRRNAHRAPPMAQEGAREASAPPGGGSGHEASQKGPQWPSATCELSDPRAGGSP